jgi:hypothetical protein
MGLSNSAPRLATSAAAIAPPSHHRRPGLRNVIIDAGCHSRFARRLAGVGSQTASTRPASIERFGSLPDDPPIHHRRDRNSAVEPLGSGAFHRLDFQTLLISGFGESGFYDAPRAARLALHAK